MHTFTQLPEGSDNALENLLNIESIVKKIHHLKKETVSFKPDEAIIEEGTPNNFVYIILEGTVQLLKHGKTKTYMLVDQFGPGDLLGLTSFWTHEPSFLLSRAITPVKCLRLQNDDVNQLVHQEPDFGKAIHRLFISNLSTRYRRMVALNIKVAELSDALEHEHRQLKQAMQELENTRNQLVHQEKLATLGQLLAGIAHEINNPCAALSRGVDSLITKLPSLFKADHVFNKFQKEAAMLNAGLTCPYWSAEEKRVRMQHLLAQYPNINRSIARRIAQLDDDAMENLGLPSKGILSDTAINDMIALIDFYELGNYLRSIQLSSSRIHKLVVSLKNYGKQDEAEWQMLDIREGIRDTLIILNNRLKYYKVQLSLNPIDMTYCIGSELNQVWTNILVNACQATAAGNRIYINTHQKNNSAIIIEFIDTGTGIPSHLLEKIFEPNVTTKKGKSDFGLGLGLAISKDIIEKHSGTIQVSNRSEGGAKFTITLPIRNSIRH